MGFRLFHPVFSPDEPTDSGSGLPMPPAGHAEPGSDDSLAEGVDSAARAEPADDNPSGSSPKYVFSRICIALIVLVWVAAGYFKISDMSRFMDIVNQHQVIPEDMKAFIWWVGPGELVLGLLLVFAIGSELRKPFGKLVLLVSLGAILGMTYYISLVDPAVLQESGCGCLSDYRIASGMENSVRFFAYAKNGMLIFLHLVALFGPAISDRLRRSG
jgi:methylamine utilization protein MauE